MTKEELEKEAEEKYSEVDREFIACQDEGEVFNIGYVLGAEPREKQIQIDAEQIRALQKQNGELTEQNTSLLTSVENLNKSVQELEARNERLCQSITDFQNREAGLELQIAELKAQIEKMKWHKVSDGDLPKDDKCVLVYREGEEPQLDYYLNEEGYWKSEKWDREYYARKGETPPVSSIIAWKEIVFPKEVEK